MSTDGVRANRRGRILERFVANILDNQGYEHIRPAYLIFAMREMQQPVYAQQVEIGRDIYGKRRRVDFLLFNPHRHPNGLVIQCKWQKTSGSVEEKFPFEVQSITQGEFETVIILDGGGYSTGAEQWLRSQAGRNRLRHVFSQREFEQFASRGSL